MKAVILNQAGKPEELKLTNLARPILKAGEVMVEIKALSINPIDVKTRSGKGVFETIRNDVPIILGWDISGVVSDAGDQETFNIGDAVFGMICFPKQGKAYAEYVAAPAYQLALKPENVSFEEAACASIAALTAWQALVEVAGISAGDRVLIHAAAGGVGHFAVQIAKHFGAFVIGTASAPNRDFVLSNGADEFIDYKEARFEEEASEMDIVLDAIGGDYIDRSLEVVRKGGTIVSLPSGRNESVESKAAAKGMKGFKMRVDTGRRSIESIAELLKQGQLRPYISKRFALAQMVQAHEAMESGKTVGKIAITM